MEEDNRIPKVVFDEGSKEFILESLGIELDNEDYLIYKDSKKRVLDFWDDEIHIDKFAGVKKRSGETVYLSSDLHTIMKLAKGEI